MQGITGKVAKGPKVFTEIDGESVSARRVRYWQWQLIQAKLQGKKATRGKTLQDGRQGGVQELRKTVKQLIAELNDVKNALAKLGITIPQAGE